MKFFILNTGVAKAAFALSLVAWLTACASIETPLDDGYQFGDLGEWREDYCTDSSPQGRAVLLALAARSGLTLPSDGICTDPLALLQEGTS